MYSSLRGSSVADTRSVPLIPTLTIYSSRSATVLSRILAHGNNEKEDTSQFSTIDCPCVLSSSVGDILRGRWMQKATAWISLDGHVFHFSRRELGSRLTHSAVASKSRLNHSVIASKSRLLKTMVDVCVIINDQSTRTRPRPPSWNSDRYDLRTDGCTEADGVRSTA